ncbi:glycoside hydrolase superfamily, partial [Lipomyces japonicus]|uniref:glycoside hydrolase superfamily n=1 Tax=Lipomyces japonicus TaxID=56871 RepID=UPI0034CD8824
MRLFLLTFFSLLLSLTHWVAAYSDSSSDNVVVYWGQASAGSQESLAYYCASDNVDIVVLSFLTTFFGSDNSPVVNFASACTSTFSGTDLLQCDQIAQDIKTCQNAGKKVLLSLGGAAGSYGFTSDSEAESFATTLWQTFGADTSASVNRPFGDSVVDGFDLDIENGNSIGYAALVTKLRQYYASSSGTYYVSAAPQCPFPDASVGDALDNAYFDFVFIQFYNNYCGVNNQAQFNYDSDWQAWVDSTSQNKNVKLYVGVPGSSSAAGSGYVTPDVLGTLIGAITDKSNLGGVMIWDASQAFTNQVDANNFITDIKSVLAGISSSSSTSSSNTQVSSSLGAAAAAATVESITSIGGTSSFGFQNLYVTAVPTSAVAVAVAASVVTDVPVATPSS